MKHAAAAGGILATLILLPTLEPCNGPAEQTASPPPETALIAAPRTPAPIPAPAQALTVASMFALDHARLLFGQIPAGRVRGAPAHLRNELRALTVPQSAARLATALRITGLEVTPTGARSATATATLTAPGQKPWPMAFELRHRSGGWQVTQINEAQ